MQLSLRWCVASMYSPIAYACAVSVSVMVPETISCGVQLIIPLVRSTLSTRPIRMIILHPEICRTMLDEVGLQGCS